jgi:hypothetical protein
MLLAAEVEALNFVLNIGHLWDVCEPVVQPATSSKKEVALEAHTFGVDGGPTYGGDGSGYGDTGVRRGQSAR